MKRLFLFNPENDIALASGLPRITPPRQAALLHRAGAMLPFWLGNAGDLILVNGDDIGDVCSWSGKLTDQYGLSGPTAVSRVDEESRLELSPWGWSHDTVAQFEKAGIPSWTMADIFGQMPARRDLSHRRTSLAFLSLWSAGYGCLPFNMPLEAQSFQVVERFVMENESAMLKSPWSSSGRGVFPVTKLSLDGSRQRIEGIIRHQGSVMVEPLMPKLLDFAMLFEYRERMAEFSGYSLFYNSTATNYGGNYVGPDELILDKLSCLVSREDIEAVRDRVAKILPCVLGDGYSGPIGIDMMVCGDGKAAGWIAPCVEINLRYTMGFVARGIWRKLRKTGRMSVSPVGSCCDGEMKKGAEPLRLVPENPWFEIMFYPETVQS